MNLDRPLQQDGVLSLLLSLTVVAGALYLYASEDIAWSGLFRPRKVIYSKLGKLFNKVAKSKNKSSN